LQIDGLRLGMTKEEALATLPGSQTLRRQALADGVNLLFAAEPPITATYWARQMFVRWGHDNRVAEIRVRYQEGPGKPTAKAPALLDVLKKADNRVAEIRVRYQEGPGKPTAKAPALLDVLKKAAGAPEELPGPWAGLWADLGLRKAPVLHRWRDDLTVLTLQRDTGGAEVVLRDCPPDRPLGVELPPLQFCSRGVDRCALGDSQTDVHRRYKVSRPPVAANGAEVLAEPESSPYDVLLVWYERGRVSRLIARQRDKQGIAEEAVTTVLQQAWARNIDRLGYVRRMEGPHGQVKAAYDWHDDVTRVRTFVQDTDQGARLFTEYRTWPIDVKPVPVVKK
jgi:hypothetical protein